MPPADQWWAETQDCDDQAMAFVVAVHRFFHVNSVGIVLNGAGRTSGHAFNVVVFDDGMLALIEPQTRMFVEPGYPDTLYDLAGAKVWM
jgi:hypothetical protein